MAKLKKSYKAICKKIKVPGDAYEGFAEDIGKIGKLTVWESEKLHPGEDFVCFKPEDGKSELQTACGDVTIEDDILTINTQENRNEYAFLLIRTNKFYRVTEEY